MSLLFSVSVETSSGVIVIWYYRAPSGTTTFAKVVKEPNGVPNTWRLQLSSGIVREGRRSFHPFTRHEDTLYNWTGVVPPCRCPDDGVQYCSDSDPLFFQVLHSSDERFDSNVDGLSVYRNGDTTMVVSYPDRWRARNARYWSSFTEGTRERIDGNSLHGQNAVVAYDVT